MSNSRTAKSPVAREDAPDRRSNEIDLGPRSKRLPWAPKMSSLFVYAIISFALVVAAADSEPPHYIAMILGGNALALWLAHAHADAVGNDERILHALGHAAPLLAFAAPGCTLFVLAWLLGWSSATAVMLAELVHLILIVTIQILASRQRRFTVRKLVLTALLDGIAAVMVVVTIKVLK